MLQINNLREWSFTHKKDISAHCKRFENSQKKIETIEILNLFIKNHFNSLIV